MLPILLNIVQKKYQPTVPINYPVVYLDERFYFVHENKIYSYTIKNQQTKMLCESSTALCYHNNTLYYGTADGYLKDGDNQILFKYSNHVGKIVGYGDKLYVGSWEGVAIYELLTQKSRRLLYCQELYTAIVGAKMYLTSGNEIWLLDLNTQELSLFIESDVIAAKFSKPIGYLRQNIFGLTADDNRLVFKYDSNVAVFDIATKEFIHVLPKIGIIDSLIVSNKLCTFSATHLQFWDVNSHKPLNDRVFF